ncbi:multidrug efflux RND transporter permease subunit [Chromatiaceae bacterium AAb-1]|nr:multidrug efflux RND transporter permease subunit [Chromatiaceae bacterium AAb-1]
MNLINFFISRPIFASVFSLLILIGGILSLPQLPVAEYPEVVPPTIVVSARFPGASPDVIAQTVAAPLEENINGIENLLYMSSMATSDGLLTLTLTFKLGMDPNLALQLTQNRVLQAESRLPEDVRRLGLSVVKSTPDLTITVHLYSPDDRYDMAYLSNYAILNIRDRITRIEGVGNVQLRGAGEYAMRIWLDPYKLAERQLSAQEVINAIRQENLQAASGMIGGAPTLAEITTQMAISVRGRLENEQEFGDIIVQASPSGGITRLRDVARIELGAAEYASRALIDGKPAAAMLVLQAPGSNTVEIGRQVRALMTELKRDMPEGVDYRIAFDPTQFVTASIDAVVVTLLEATVLVVLVVILFLQTWRASLIPLLAVPVSIVGTFGVMWLLGYSVNTLTLFGLVLAIGIVVDDAIVVVENVERNIALGHSPKAASYLAMKEVAGPIIAISLVLCAVFVPLAFASGLTGQFNRQFAMTIAISTVISAINSLTLSPALSALLLQPHGARPDKVSRAINRVLGSFFRRFNLLFNRGSDAYGNSLGWLAGHKSAFLLIYLLLAAITFGLFRQLPAGFVPPQDRGYLISAVQLPDGATLDRTEQVMRQMSELAGADPGVAATLAFPGLSISGFTNSSNAGILFTPLRDFAERNNPEMTAQAIAERLRAQYAGLYQARVVVFAPPPVRGLGTTGGFRLQLEDKAALGYNALDQATRDFIAAARHRPELSTLFTTFQINVPQLHAEVDRTRARQLDVAIPDIFNTLQTYLGSAYVNDFNRFGRTYTVRAQADARFRATVSDVNALQVKSQSGDMIPLASLIQLTDSFGPERVMRYNGFPSSDISGSAAEGYSSGQARAAIEQLAEEILPSGIGFEWTDLTYQEILAGNSGLWLFALSVLLVYLVLSALYENLLLPLSILLIVPMAVLSALTGIWLTDGDINVFTQIGLVVLVGLSAKNAILIVEFASQLEKNGQTPLQAVMAACRLRLRPILMTSMAFIIGVTPLLLSTGPGFELRQQMGVTVFAGMLGVTVFGLILTPLFYLMLRKAVDRLSSVKEIPDV